MQYMPPPLDAGGYRAQVGLSGCGHDDEPSHLLALGLVGRSIRLCQTRALTEGLRGTRARIGLSVVSGLYSEAPGIPPDQMAGQEVPGTRKTHSYTEKRERMMQVTNSSKFHTSSTFPERPGITS